MGTRATLLVCVAGFGLAACSVRPAAYHFRSPLVGAVSADRVALPERAEPVPVRNPVQPSRLASAESADSPQPKPQVKTIPARSLAPADRGHSLAARLRELVGARDDEASHVQFALATLGHVGARLDDQVRDVQSGAELVALAEQRSAIMPLASESIASPPRLGDLLVFDEVVDKEPASLIAVVVSIDERGAIEMIYLGRGVVRRGWVTPQRPDDTRDDQGRVLNTFVRHSDGRDPRGTRYLAGQLVRAIIRLDQLTGTAGTERPLAAVHDR